MKKDAKGIAVLMPGIGYTCDKPLLYYGGKLARGLGWEVLPVPYGGFPPKERDGKYLAKCAAIALTQAEELLAGVKWEKYESVLLLSKSIGTAVAARYAAAHGIACRHVFFTPLEDTFACPVEDAVAFHGTADPWAETARIRALCEKAGIPLYETEGANHSLETGDVAKDIENVASVMRRVEEYMREYSAIKRG